MFLKSSKQTLYLVNSILLFITKSHTDSGTEFRRISAAVFAEIWHYETRSHWILNFQFINTEGGLALELIVIPISMKPAKRSPRCEPNRSTVYTYGLFVAAVRVVCEFYFFFFAGARDDTATWVRVGRRVSMTPPPRVNDTRGRRLTLARNRSGGEWEI